MAASARITVSRSAGPNVASARSVSLSVSAGRDFGAIEKTVTTSFDFGEESSRSAADGYDRARS
jgi:hypothetical protein